MTMKTPSIYTWAPDGKVLLLKTIYRDGTSYGGFSWPKSGPVKAKTWSPEPTCESGGLFGWPWGFGFGEGMIPDFLGIWVVFAADPETVVPMGYKAKVPEAEVVYYGDFIGALQCLLPGIRAWEEKYGPMAPPDDPAITLSSYRYGLVHGAVAVNTHEGGLAASVGNGDDGVAITLSPFTAAVATEAAIAQGDGTIAGIFGRYGIASAHGRGAIACGTQRDVALECGEDGVCVSTAPTVYWMIRPGSVLVQRLVYESAGDMRGQAVIFYADDYPDLIGKLVQIRDGVLYGPHSERIGVGIVCCRAADV